MKTFYQSHQFEPRLVREVRRSLHGAEIGFSDRDPEARDRILAYFEQSTCERAGVLHGEYLLMENGLLLVDRRGVFTAINMAWEDPAPVQAAANYALAPAVLAEARRLLSLWDALPYVADVPILSDPYSANYYHFCLELAPRIRYFENSAQRRFLIPQSAMRATFQRDMLVRAMRGFECLPFASAVRVRDPLLIHDVMNDNSLFWIRRNAGLAAAPGDRRVYIRRTVRGTRTAPGGGIVEDEAFLKVLAAYGFETIDFGGGEHTIGEQIAMLDGAGVILSAHGAALSNLTFVSPPTTLVELIGARTPRACFVHIAATMGLGYHGLYSDDYDEAGDIRIDAEELEAVLRSRIGAP